MLPAAPALQLFSHQPPGSGVGSYQITGERVLPQQGAGTTDILTRHFQIIPLIDAGNAQVPSEGSINNCYAFTLQQRFHYGIGAEVVSVRDAAQGHGFSGSRRRQKFRRNTDRRLCARSLQRYPKLRQPPGIRRVLRLPACRLQQLTATTTAILFPGLHR